MKDFLERFEESFAANSDKSLKELLKALFVDLVAEQPAKRERGDNGRFTKNGDDNA